jgi:hypothetical protein
MIAQCMTSKTYFWYVCMSWAATITGCYVKYAIFPIPIGVAAAEKFVTGSKSPVRERQPTTAAAPIVHCVPPIAMVLSDDDLRFFAKHGWVIARQVIDEAQCERTAAEVW